MNVGKPVGRMKSPENYVCYFKVDAVFNREPGELLEENMWTAGLRIVPDKGPLNGCVCMFADIKIKYSICDSIHDMFTSDHTQTVK